MFSCSLIFRTLGRRRRNTTFTGGVAKWIRNGLQSRLHWFESSPRLQFLSADFVAFPAENGAYATDKGLPFSKNIFAKSCGNSG